MTAFRFRFVLSAVLITCFAISASAQKAPTFKQPVLLTSAGQSADVTMASTLLKKAKIEALAKPLAQPADLKDIHTLIVVAGFSSKGLGAAGISREDEMNRVTTLLEAAKKAKIPVLTMHLGGAARRGSQSDDFNKVAAEAASYLLIVKQGDEDSFFSSIAQEKKIPIEVVDKIAGAVAPLQSVIP
jgi:hypothetical protein